MDNEKTPSTDQGATEPSVEKDLRHRDEGIDAVGGRDVEPFDVVGAEDESEDDDAVGGVDVRDPESVGGEDQGGVGDAIGGVDERDLESIGGVDVDEVDEDETRGGLI